MATDAAPTPNPPPLDRFAAQFETLVAAGHTPEAFLREVALALHAATRSPSIELWVIEEQGWKAATLRRGGDCETVQFPADEGPPSLNAACTARHLDPVGWDKGVLSASRSDRLGKSDPELFAIIPLEAPGMTVGWVVLQQVGEEYVWRREVEWFRRASPTVAVGLVAYRVHSQLFDVTRRVVRDMQRGPGDIQDTRPDPSLAPSSRAQESPLLSLAEVEAAHIRRVLEHTRGNKSAAARILGIDRKTLRNKLARGSTPPAAAGSDAGDRA